MQNPAVRKTFVIVERMLEETHTASVAIEHQVFPNETGRVGQTVGKLLVGGEQEQAWGLRAIGADDDRFSSLKVSVLLLIEINGTGGAARSVQLDAMDIGIRTNFTAPGALGNRDHAHEGAGLRANFTTKAPAKAAVPASAATGTRLRKNCHWSGKGMQAECASGAFENHARRFHWQWRHGIRLQTWRIKRARARQT